MGSVVLLITVTSVTNDSLLSTRDSVSVAVPEKLSLEESESEVPMPPPPRPKAPTTPASPLSPSRRHRPQPSPDGLTPQYLQTTAQLPQRYFACSPQQSGVDRIANKVEAYGDAAVHPMYVPSPGILSDGTMTAASSLVDEDELSGLAPRGSAEIGNFTPVICEPPEDIASEAWSSVPLHTTDSTSLPTPSEGFGHSFDGTIPHISITLAKSSRGNSPLAPPSCDSDVSVKRPSVHVDTGSAAQATGVMSAGFIDGLSPFSRSAVLASPQPRSSTTDTSSSGLSPFSRMESPSTAATTPAQSANSETPQDALTSAPDSHAKQRKERPTIDTSCVGPGGRVRKYRNGSVPPVNVPAKLRNASLDLPRSREYEKYEPNPSMYSIAPSISPRRYKKSGDLRCPSSQPPASRQGLAASTRAPSIRREPLEFDEAQICLDTASLGDQEVATFLKEVDAALSAITNGSPAVAADSRAFLAVPSASRLVSRNQSRKPSSQHLRADLSATIRSHEKEGAARTGFSLVATSHPSPHPDVIPSRVASPLLSGHTEAVQRIFLSQVDVPPSSMPGGSSRSALPASPFPLPQRVSPQPSPRQELVEWISPSLVSPVSTRTREHLQPSRRGSYYADISGNENSSEVLSVRRGRRA